MCKDRFFLCYGMSFHGGGRSHVELVGAGGRDPVKRYRLCKTSGVRRVFDKESKHYVWCFEANGNNRLCLGDVESGERALGLVHPCVVVQMLLPLGSSSFALEASVKDASGKKRRIFLSTAFVGHAASTTPLHARLPLAAALRDCRGHWVNWRIDLAAVATEAFQEGYQCLDGLCVRAPSCKLRAILTLSDTYAPIPAAFQVLGTQDAPQIFPHASAFDGQQDDGVCHLEGLSVVGRACSTRGGPHLAFGTRLDEKKATTKTPPATPQKIFSARGSPIPASTRTTPKTTPRKKPVTPDETKTAKAAPFSTPRGRRKDRDEDLQVILERLRAEHKTSLETEPTETKTTTQGVALRSSPVTRDRTESSVATSINFSTLDFHAPLLPALDDDDDVSALSEVSSFEVPRRKQTRQHQRPFAATGDLLSPVLDESDADLQDPSGDSVLFQSQTQEAATRRPEQLPRHLEDDGASHSKSDRRKAESPPSLVVSLPRRKDTTSAQAEQQEEHERQNVPPEEPATALASELPPEPTFLVEEVVAGEKNDKGALPPRPPTAERAKEGPSPATLILDPFMRQGPTAAASPRLPSSHVFNAQKGTSRSCNSLQESRAERATEPRRRRQWDRSSGSGSLAVMPDADDMRASVPVGSTLTSDAAQELSPPKTAPPRAGSSKTTSTQAEHWHMLGRADGSIASLASPVVRDSRVATAGATFDAYDDRLFDDHGLFFADDERLCATAPPAARYPPATMVHPSAARPPFLDADDDFCPPLITPAKSPTALSPPSPVQKKSPSPRASVVDQSANLDDSELLRRKLADLARMEDSFRGEFGTLASVQGGIFSSSSFNNKI